MRGVYAGTNAGNCCWLAPQASFEVVQPAGADVLLLAFAIPPYALRTRSTDVVVSVGDAPPSTLCCFSAGSNEAVVPVVPARVARTILVRVRAGNVFVPKLRGIGQDPRKLTILLQSVAFQTTALGVRYVNGVSETMAPAVQTHRGLALALALLAGVAALLLTLWRVRFAWLALLIAAPVSLAVYVGGTTVTVDKAVVAGVVLGMLCTFKRLRALRTPAFYWVGGALLLTIAAMVASALVAAHTGAALRAVLMNVEYFAALAVALAAYACDPDERLLRNVLAIVVLAVSASAFVQIFTGAPQGEFVLGHEFARIAGLLDGPNQLSGYLGVMLAVPLGFVLFGRSTVLERFALVVGVIALLLTFSRGGLLGLAAVAVVLIAARLAGHGRAALLRAAFAVWVLLAAGAVVGAFVLFGHSLAAGHGAMAYNGGLGTRSELWSAAIALWRQHPVLGVGPNNFEVLVGSFFPGVRTHVNGQLLQALAEGGVVGFLTLLAMIAATLHALRRGAGVLGVAVFAMVLGFWTHELFDSLLLYPKVGLPYWVLIGIALAALPPESHSTDSPT